MGNQTIGMFLIGIALGLYMPGLPAPLDLINPYVGFGLIVVAVVLFVKGE
ncbi:MAG: hypothetical protein Q7S92_02915 [Candidatus Diapherotrites archaeon]|nr:hypothetical protein [Candidatus Diapherotrites archaeon]